MRSTFRAACAAAASAALVLGTAGLAVASDVDVAVVDVTAPVTAVELRPGETGAITIEASVTGNQLGTATFEVYQDWTLSGGEFEGSNPVEFTVARRAGGDPPTEFSTTGSVTVEAGHPAGSYDLSVGVFDITNTNQTGGKLRAGDPGSYTVIVSAPPPTDTTAPVVTPTVVGTLGTNGWYTSDVTVSWDVTDPESAFETSGCDTATVDHDTEGATFTCIATSTGGTTSESVTIKRDATVPTIQGAVSPTSPDGTNGWYKSAPTVSFTCEDTGSGVQSCTEPATLDESPTAQSVTGTAFDRAGNSASTTVEGLLVDLSDPTNVTFVGDIADGDSFPWGDIPADPRCTASDAVSGLVGCVVTGYSTAVGTHTLTATATDNAGRTAIASMTYTVDPWRHDGFYRPVDMGKVNTVKAGSTVPLKFNVFKGDAPITDVAVLDATFTVKRISCDTGEASDAIEEFATTGGTELRYDADAQQWVQNWATPKTGKGNCYLVGVTTPDGTATSAKFQLR